MHNSAPDSRRGVRLFFRLIARFFPYNPPLSRSEDTLDALAPRFKKWNQRALLLLLFCAPFNIWGSKALLSLIFKPSLPPAGAVHHLVADPAFMLLPAIFIGIIFSALPVSVVVFLFLKKQFSDYIHYGNLLVGFNALRVWIALSVMIGSFSLYLAWAATSMQFTLYDDRLEIRRMASLRTERHAYGAISRAEFAQFEGRPGVSLIFNDGSEKWSSSDSLGILSVIPESLAFLKTHLPKAVLEGSARKADVAR